MDDQFTAGLQEKADVMTNDGRRPISTIWSISSAKYEDLGRLRVSMVRKTPGQGDLDGIAPKLIRAERRSFTIPIEENPDCGGRCGPRRLWT